MNKFEVLPGETGEQWKQRYDQIMVEIDQFKDVIDKIVALSKQTGREPATSGFFHAWLGIMFEHMDANDRRMAMERFIAYDQELLMIKLAGEPA